MCQGLATELCPFTCMVTFKKVSVDIAFLLGLGEFKRREVELGSGSELDYLSLQILTLAFWILLCDCVLLETLEGGGGGPHHLSIVVVAVAGGLFGLYES